MQSSTYRIAIIAVIVAFAVIIASKLSPERKIPPDADAKAFADAAVVAICTNWDRDELLNRASPELVGAIQVNGPDLFFGKLTAVGRLTKYEGAVGRAERTVYNGNAKVTAHYKAKGRFEKGPAAVDISLVRFNENSWQISAFTVDPGPPASPFAPEGKSP
jgi:hypothetical protein